MFGKLNRQAIYGGLVLFFLALGAYVMSSVELPPWSRYVSSAGVVLFALPSFWAVRRWLGWPDGGVLVASLAACVILLEASAVLTGFPYGHFGYSELLGYRIFGLVPWTVAFAWTPLILGAYSVAANLIANQYLRVLTTALIVSLFELVIGPGAVMWGVEKQFDGGWFVCGLIGAVLIEAHLERIKPLLPTPVQLASSAMLIVFFWSAAGYHNGQPGSAAFGLVILGGLAAFYRTFHYSFDDKIVFVDENDNPVGTGDKLASHTDDTKLHRGFSVFLFNPQGEFLMQQRALSKKTWPGVWSNSVCGHVMLHEATEAAAKRRLRYELGLTGIDLELALPNFRYRAEKDGVVENEFCPVFVGVTDKQPRPNPAEVEAVKWVVWDEFVESLDDPETDISPWAVEEVRELLLSDVFRRVYPRRSN